MSTDSNTVTTVPISADGTPIITNPVPQPATPVDLSGSPMPQQTIPSVITQPQHAIQQQVLQSPPGSLPVPESLQQMHQLSTPSQQSTPSMPSVPSNLPQQTSGHEYQTPQQYQQAPQQQTSMPPMQRAPQQYQQPQQQVPQQQTSMPPIQQVPQQQFSMPPMQQAPQQYQQPQQQFSMPPMQQVSQVPQQAPQMQQQFSMPPMQQTPQQYQQPQVPTTPQQTLNSLLKGELDAALKESTEKVLLKLVPAVKEFVEKKTGQQCNIDEVCAHFGTSMKIVSANPIMNTMPPMQPNAGSMAAFQAPAFAGPVGVAAATTSNRGKPETGKCTYTFTKGQRQGQMCGAKCYEGSPLCTTHSKRAGGTPVTPAVATAPQTMMPPQQGQMPAQGQPGKITVKLFKDLPSQYYNMLPEGLDPNSSVVKLGDDKTVAALVKEQKKFIVIGTHDGSGFKPVVSSLPPPPKPDFSVEKHPMCEIIGGAPQQGQMPPMQQFQQMPPMQAPQQYSMPPMQPPQQYQQPQYNMPPMQQQYNMPTMPPQYQQQPQQQQQWQQPHQQWQPGMQQSF